MTDAEVPRHPDAFALWREVQDTRIRTRLGGFYYLLAWLLAWLFSADPFALLASGLGGVALFASLLLARQLHCAGTAEHPPQLQRWLDQHWALLLLTALCWGQAHAWILYHAEFADSALIATLATVAFCTAMTFNFAMRKQRALLAIALLYLPGLVILALDWTRQLALLVTLSCYLSYLLLVLGRSHREYHATLALELKLLEQQARLERLSRTDSLTQLGNRYQFNKLFPALVAGAQRRGEPLSLVLLDIDWFKRVNDEHGHTSGDACLKAFAERLREVFRRDGDALLRLGGEEFGVLMPNTNLTQAAALGERFRQDLARNGLRLGDQLLPLTASLGVGSFDARLDVDADAFFRRVDRALYRAKAQGRDRLVQADDLPSKTPSLD